MEQRYRRKQGKREKKRELQKERKKEKNCTLGVFGRTLDFNISLTEDLILSLLHSFETRNFVC